MSIDNKKWLVSTSCVAMPREQRQYDDGDVVADLRASDKVELHCQFEQSEEKCLPTFVEANNAEAFRNRQAKLLGLNHGAGGYIVIRAYQSRRTQVVVR